MKIPNLLLILAAIIAPGDATVTDTSEKKCNVELIQNYGLHGLNVAERVSLKMCPDVQHSCCQESDQMEIYFNWIGSHKKKLVTAHYKDVADLYVNFFDELKEVHSFSEKIMRMLEQKPVANCKIIAQVLKKFSIRELEQKIRENFRQMEQFFMESYQGFYCSICNYDNHQFINKEKATVTMSSKFCRDIVESTLPTLLFFYDDLTLYLNTVTRFLESCNYQGKYKTIEELPEKHKLSPNPDFVKSLNECADNRNKDSWLHFCAPICENFSLAKLNQFFEPRRKEITKYIKYIKSTLQKHRSMDSQAAKAKNTRILEGKKEGQKNEDTDEKEKQKKTYVKPKGPAVHTALDEKKIDMEKYKLVFEDEGISLLDEGKNSLINHQIYTEVKAVVEKDTSNLKILQRGLRLIEGGKAALKGFLSYFL